MNNKIISAIIIFFSVNITEAQEEPKNIFKNFEPGYFKASLSAGTTGILNSKRGNISKSPGFVYTLDVSFNSAENVAFFFNYTSSYFSGNSYHSEILSGLYNSKNINFTQLTIGPRFFSDNKNLFVDGSAGYFNMDGKDYPGFTAGLGGNFEITDALGFNLTARMNAADVFNNPFTYYNITAGISYRNIKNHSPEKITGSKISISALAGSYGRNQNEPQGVSFGAEISYAATRKSSMLFNYIYTNSKTEYPESSGIPRSYDFSHSEITGGIRYYLFGDNLKLFVEGLSGLYMLSFKDSENLYNKSNSFYGFTVGAGVEFKLIKDLSGIAKTDLSSYITEGSYLGIFGGLKFSL
ncbi:MAG TPA: hypothetical protein PKA90_10435 [Ignavibacteria bacterium]|nr:hypothetical protein [Ignavibacteria bacterium]